MAWESLTQEISNLMNLKHQGIVALYDYGNSGVICTPAGSVIYKQVFIVMEYVSGGSLWDLTQEMGGMGEAAGKFFLNQMLEVLEFMHNVRKIVHRDLKPENILIDDQLNIKFADFGFSTSKNIDGLTSFAGSNTYIAPEVKALRSLSDDDRKPYNGKEADLFSLGVILFLLVKGTFPFLNADEEDFYYSKIIAGDVDAYFAWVDKDNTLSAEFRDLTWRLFCPQGGERPSLSEIRKHPWLNEIRQSEETKSDNHDMTQCRNVVI